jgi:hypothetical protein
MAARGMVEEMLSLQMLYSDARSCPKCRMTISKTEGCNKVVCISCGQAFCFICGKAIIAGYSHFEYVSLIYLGSFFNKKRTMVSLLTFMHVCFDKLQTELRPLRGERKGHNGLAEEIGSARS